MMNSSQRRASNLNIRKVTADFNNYFIESKNLGSNNTPLGGQQEETKNDKNFTEECHKLIIPEEPVTLNRERRESYAAECESELRDLIINEIGKKVSRIFSV